MGERLMALYHRLPAPLRTVAASARGVQLSWWRYGPGAERLVVEALERERWPEERMRTWQEERLAALLDRAAKRVPYYRRMWSERRRRGDRAPVEVLESWPLLEKDALRLNPEAFVADDRSTRDMFEVKTSGTSGKPLTLWRSRRANREYYALLEARFRRWHGVDRRRPWAILGGQVVVPPGAAGPPYWVWNRALRQLYLSANHVGPRTVAAYVEALERHRIEHLVAYSSSAAELARQCLAAGVSYRGLRVVVTNAEPLSPGQREVIGRAFGAPVRETYGMVEIVAGASECEHGRLHLWPELGRVEVVADEGGRPAAAGETGRLVCTGLVNTDMPLVRYLVGDRGKGRLAAEPCACGRSLPSFGAVEGRTNDMLISPDGRRVYWVNPVFYGMPVQESQVVQERLDLVRVRYVPGDGFSEASAGTIAERLRVRMGEVQVVLEEVDEIPRGPNGKFKAVVCLLRPEQGGEGPPEAGGLRDL